MKEKEKIKPAANREIVQIGEEINKIENRNTVQKVNKIKIKFFEKINKINNTLSILAKKKSNVTKIKESRQRFHTFLKS